MTKIVSFPRLGKRGGGHAFAAQHSDQRKNELKRIAADHLRRGEWGQWLLCIVLIAGGWLTTDGLITRAQETFTTDFSGILTSILGGLLAAIIIGVCTTILMGIALDATSKEKWSVVWLALFLGLVLLLVSTWSALVGYAGDASVVFAMQDLAQSWSAYADHVLGSGGAAKDASAALVGVTAEICSIASAELNGAAPLTDQPGMGAVSASYFAGCENVTAIKAALDATASDIAAARLEVDPLLASLSATPENISISVFERRGEFNELSGGVRSALSDTSAINLTERLSAQLAILQASVANLGVQDGEFGDRQFQAIESLRQKLQTVAAVVTPLAQTTAETVPMPGQLGTSSEYVFFYFERNLTPIFLCLAVDGTVIFLCLARMVSRSALQSHESLFKAEAHTLSEHETALPELNTVSPIKNRENS